MNSRHNCPGVLGPDIVPRSVGLDDDTALRPAGDGTWEGEILPGWETPRGPLGGYVMAIVLRGLALAVDDPERQPRSATMHFLRVPGSGPVTERSNWARQCPAMPSGTASVKM